MNRSRFLTLASAVAATAFAILFPIGTASATTTDLDGMYGESTMNQQVAEVLAEFPGGTRIGYNEISWNDGAVIQTLAETDGVALRAVGSCPVGAFCAYSGYSLGGSRTAYYSCDTTHPTYGTVLSLANAWGSGYVRAKNSSGTTLTTVYNNGSNNFAPAGISQIQCVS